MRWWLRMPAGVAVWQPYGAAGVNGLDGLGDMWHAGKDAPWMDAGADGKWRVECGCGAIILMAWCERDVMLQWLRKRLRTRGADGRYGLGRDNT